MSQEPLNRDARADAAIAEPGWTSATWEGAEAPPNPRKHPLQMLRGALRLGAFVLSTLLLLPFFFIARAIGGRNDRAIAALWCYSGARLCGLRVRQIGEPLKNGGALLANHASWLDIMVLGWLAPVHFVAKAEVASWPFFGWIGKISNTVFIARKRTEAKEQERQLAARALGGDLLCLFPEGTSTDGRRVLPFKSSLFSLFFTNGRGALKAQAVTIHYQPRAALPASFYCWWGRMSLFQHIWDLTTLGSGGVATVIFHPTIDPSSTEGRKDLAAQTQALCAQGRDDAEQGRA